MKNTSESQTIIHLLPHLRNVGNGITNAAVDLVLAQSALGHHVIVASGGGEYSEQLDLTGIELRHVELKNWRRPRGFLRGLRQLRAILKQSPDCIIHCHTLIGLLFAFGVGARKRVVTVHNSWQRFTYLNLVMAHQVIVLSAADLARFRRYSRILGGRNKIHKVVNGVVGSVRYPDSIVPKKLAKPALVTVAGLYERKGIQDLIEAIALLDDKPYLYIVGDGPYRGALESLVSRLGLHDHVKLVGFSEQPMEYMMSADIFVLASRDEPAGLVLTEARMCGKPIVATDVGGIPTMLSPDAGVLVPARDPKALANAVYSLMQSAEELAAAGRRARIGLDYFSVSRVAEDVLSVYQSGVPNPLENTM